MPASAPVTFVTPMRRVLLFTAAGLAVLLPVGTVAGWLFGGSQVGWGILLGLAVPAAFLGLTVLTGLLAARLGNTRFVAVVVASWLVKLILLIVVLAQLRGAEFFSTGAFFIAFVVGVAGWLLTEVIVVLRTRVPYIDEPRGA
jgi:hypothetical protein